ncbi:autotransporter strand-loop-strand O-heptosyltransferase, partial [Escherichia coli]|nr:autotransporter strand-loop-strand O-heptosyltransferase [Escherichia coli]
KPYATYRIGLFFNGDTDNQPVDFRLVGFHRNAGYILGVSPQEAPPRLNLSAERKIQEPYVCIAVQSTAQAKHWNNGPGWAEVVSHLKELG